MCNLTALLSVRWEVPTSTLTLMFVSLEWWWGMRWQKWMAAFYKHLPFSTEAGYVNDQFLLCFVLMSLQSKSCVGIGITRNKKWTALKRSLQFAEQSNSHTNPGSMGHEEQAIPHWHWDQSVGHRLLCTTEAVHWTPAQVSEMFQHGADEFSVGHFEFDCRKPLICGLVVESYENIMRSEFAHDSNTQTQRYAELDCCMSPSQKWFPTSFDV